MTLRLYADRGLPLTRVSVRLRHSKIHAEDCRPAETAEGRVDRIDRVLTLRATWTTLSGPGCARSRTSARCIGPSHPRSRSGPSWAELGWAARGWGLVRVTPRLPPTV